MGVKILSASLPGGDWVIYYSSKDAFKGGHIYQKFTAIGKIKDDEPYQPGTKKK